MAQANVVQAIAIIDFPNQSALEQFEQDVTPLPIQFKYEGELTGGFQFVDQQMRDRLNERPDLVSVPDAATLATFEPNGSFMASSSGASHFAVSSTQFTNQDHSFAQFPDLMVLDIDRPFEQVLLQFEERCQQHPEELWALHSTQHGTHAMRLDAPVRPDQADPEFMMSVGVDQRYLKLAQQENEWTARITPKQGQQHDRIQLEEIVGTGEPDPKLLQRATAYQVALVDNGMDAPESINYLTLTQDRSNEAMPMAAEPQGDYQIKDASSLTIATDGACSGNPGPGGWGAVLIQGDRTLEIGGAAPDTTSNRMEMTAVIEGLKFVKETGLLEEGATAHIITDSQILAKGATGEWKRKANQDLWAEYDAAAAGTYVEFEWVRGHQGHPLNERADAIATSFAQGKSIELEQPNLIQPSVTDEGITPITPVGKPVKMAFPLMMHGEKNPLPVDTCLDAMRGYGRTHTTRSYEPYKAYGFKEGDIAIASSGSKQVAFQVGKQYQITPAMMNDPTYQQQWAAQEKHSPKVLQSFQGKNAWGLKMEPLGDYQDGKITPFPDRSSKIYSPSREELRQWCAVAISSGDEPRTAEVIDKGKQLNALYTQETGSSEKPPMEYRHPALVISQSDRQQMQQAIAAGKQTLATLAQSQQPQTPQPQTHKASAELTQ